MNNNQLIQIDTNYWILLHNQLTTNALQGCFGREPGLMI